MANDLQFYREAVIAISQILLIFCAFIALIEPKKPSKKRFSPRP